MNVNLIKLKYIIIKFRSGADGNTIPNNYELVQQIDRLVVDVNAIAKRVHENQGNKIIAKYNKKMKDIEKFVKEVDVDENEKGISTYNKSIIIDGIKGMNSIELDFSNVVENCELEIDKDILYEEEGETSSNMLTFNTTAVEKVDVSNVVLNVRRDPMTKELIKEYEINKDVNRSRGPKIRKDILTEEEILPDIGELFNSIEVNIDDKSINAGVINDNTITRISLFGEDVDVFGDKKLTYISYGKYYPVVMESSPMFVFCLKLINNHWSLIYKRIDITEEELNSQTEYKYYLGNRVHDYQFDNCYLIGAYSGETVNQLDYDHSKILFYNKNDELLYSTQFHYDISISRFEVNEYESMLNGTYTVELENLDIYITGDNVVTQDVKEFNINGNCNLVVRPDTPANYIGELKLKVNAPEEYLYFKFNNKMFSFSNNLREVNSQNIFEFEKVNNDDVVWYMPYIKTSNTYVKFGLKRLDNEKFIMKNNHYIYELGSHEDEDGMYLIYKYYGRINNTNYSPENPTDVEYGRIYYEKYSYDEINNIDKSLVFYTYGGRWCKEFTLNDDIYETYEIDIAGLEDNIRINIPNNEIVLCNLQDRLNDTLNYYKVGSVEVINFMDDVKTVQYHGTVWNSPMENLVRTANIEVARLFKIQDDAFDYDTYNVVVYYQAYNRKILVNFSRTDEVSDYCDEVYDPNVEGNKGRIFLGGFIFDVNWLSNDSEDERQKKVCVKVVFRNYYGIVIFEDWLYGGGQIKANIPYLNNIHRESYLPNHIDFNTEMSWQEARNEIGVVGGIPMN